ncbi:MAG: glycosyltransferase [Candidatus Rokubacteria bacterium]|nr:glycosyltransferase [Candidatus Rokubacteria bacterium]
MRKALGLPASGPLLFTVRNLEARMGLDALIRATGILRRHFPDVLLLLGGAGSRREELESLAASLDLKDHVHFLGFVPEEQLPRYYQAADAFVLPTRELEGFGLVTVEALACGTPVLGTPVGATPEILRPLDPRLMFRDTRPEAMADDLRRFLDADGRDPAAGQRLRQACRDHATTRYRWDDAVGHLERTLRDLVSRRGVPADRAPTCRGNAEEEGP